MEPAVSELELLVEERVVARVRSMFDAAEGKVGTFLATARPNPDDCYTA